MFEGAVVEVFLFMGIEVHMYDCMLQMSFFW